MSPTPTRLGLQPNYLDIHLVERGATSTPSEGDLCLSISAHMDDFTGRYDAVWISQRDWTSFLNSLRTLERDRRGRATLLSMSPDEFALHLEITSPAGHLAAHGHLSRYHFHHPTGTTSTSRIEFHTAIDAGLLRQLVEDFTSLPHEPA